MSLILSLLHALDIAPLIRKGRGGGGRGGSGGAGKPPFDPQEMMKQYMLKQALYGLDNPDKAVDQMNLDRVPKISIGGGGGAYRPPDVEPGVLSPRR